MILVILAISIALIIGGWITYQKATRWSQQARVGDTMQIVGVILTVVASIALVALLIGAACLAPTEAKIEMYEEENAKIEAQIAEVVTQYQQYEQDIFKDVSPESAMTMVSLYPELKSDTLVQSQIELYVENNKHIKLLKEQLIDRSVVNWWLYFGN